MSMHSVAGSSGGGFVRQPSSSLGYARGNFCGEVKAMPPRQDKVVLHTLRANLSGACDCSGRPKALGRNRTVADDGAR